MDSRLRVHEASSSSGTSRRTVALVTTAVLLGAVLAAATSGHSPGRQLVAGDRVLIGGSHRPGADPSIGALGMRQRPADPPAVQLVPGAPGYDPTRLRGLVTLGQIFEGEPRSAAWADAVEPWISKQLTADLKRAVPEAAEVTVSCRTTVCKLRWSGPAGAGARVKTVVDALYTPSVVTRAGDHELLVAYKGGYLGPVEDPDALFRALKEKRSRSLVAMRSGRGFKEALSAVPAELWPEE